MKDVLRKFCGLGPLVLIVAAAAAFDTALGVWLASFLSWAYLVGYREGRIEEAREQINARLKCIEEDKHDR